MVNNCFFPGLIMVNDQIVVNNCFRHGLVWYEMQNLKSNKGKSAMIINRINERLNSFNIYNSIERSHLLRLLLLLLAHVQPVLVCSRFDCCAWFGIRETITEYHFFQSRRATARTRRAAQATRYINILKLQVYIILVYPGFLIMN